jgi:riboflavin synthase
MFTGIVEELGSVVSVSDTGDGVRLRVRGPLAVSDATHGASIAVNGVCLTVVEHDAETFTADVMAETLRASSLGGLVDGSPVNLERPVRLADRLGGHLVQGHVDAVGTVAARTPSQHWEVVRIAAPGELLRYVVPKGSVAVDGISLTVVEVDEGSFTVSLIPTTLALTTLGSADVGSPVNLEVDVMAKYAEKLLAGRVVA